MSIRKHIKWFIWYLYNEDIDVIFDIVYPDSHSVYLEEKKELFIKDRVSWYASLDEDHQEMIIDAMVNKYDKDK